MIARLRAAWEYRRYERRVRRWGRAIKRTVFDTLYADLPNVQPRPLTPLPDLDTPPYLRIREEYDYE